MATNVTIPEGFRVVSQTPAIPDGFKIVNQPTTEEKSYGLGRLAAIDSGATFGFGRKLGGLLNAIGSYPVDRAAEALGVENTPSFKDRYNEIIQPVVQAKEEYQQDKPAEALALELGSSLVNPLNKVGVGYIGKGATNVSKGLRSIGVGSATGVTAAAGNTENIDELGTNVASGAGVGGAVGGALPIMGAAVRGSGSLLRQILGKTTGAGDVAIADAFKAGRAGNTKFLRDMNGNIDAEGLGKKVQANFDKIKNARNTAYDQDITRLKLGTMNKKLDIEPVLNDARLIIKEVEGETPYLVKGQERQVIDEVKGMLKDFAKDTKNHNLSGFDSLKQGIQGITTKEGSKAEMLQSKIANSVKSQILKQSPEYKAINDAYAKDSELLTDLKKVFSLNRNANSETVLKKMQSTARNNANTDWGYRAQLLKKLDPTGEIQQEISANALSQVAPRGGIAGLFGGAGLLSAIYNPTKAPLLIGSSPAAVGYGAYGLGKATNYIPNSTTLTPYIAQLLNGGN